MKKFYVLAAATMLVASASAAGVSMKSTAKAPVFEKKALIQAAAPTCPYSVEANFVASKAVSKKVIKKAGPVKGDAYYKRPAGSLYGSMVSGAPGAAYPNPDVTAKPYATTTFVAQDADAYNWSVQLYNSQVKNRQWLTDAGHQELGVQYGYESDSVPSLSNGVTEYHVGGIVKNSQTGVETPGWAILYSIPEYKEFTYQEGAGSIMFSPKFFARRFGSQYTHYSNGITAGDGYLFGKNTYGWTGTGLYVEKPENPYLLRSVYLLYNNLNLAAAEAKCKVQVFKTEEAEDGDANFDRKLGELICEGTGTFVQGESEAQGVLEVTFMEEFDDLEMEVTPTIDEAIMIVVSGFESDDFNSIALGLSYDEYDEGYGQHAYSLAGTSEGFTKCLEVGSLINGELGVVAPTVFLDILNPYLTLAWSMEDGVREFTVDGKCKKKFEQNIPDYDLDDNQIQLFSYSSAEEMEFTLEDGSDLPEWLTIEAEDEIEEGELTGQVFLTFTVAANTGVAREANIKVSIPGDYVVLTIKQDGNAAPVVKGDVNGDGKVDVEDINIMIDIILETSTLDQYPNADVNGDGKVDVEDINAVIDIILAA